MKRAIFATALLLAPVAGWAQTPTLSPELEAAQQRIIQLTGDALQWQAQTIALQRQAADLQKKLADAKTAPQEKAP